MRISASVSRTERLRRDDVAGELELACFVGNAEQRTRVAHRQRARREVGAHFLGQPQQPDVIGDRRSILADGVGDLLLREVEIVHEPAIGVRFLDRIQVFALDVLDERDRQQPGLQECRERPREL